MAVPGVAVAYIVTFNPIGARPDIAFTHEFVQLVPDIALVKVVGGSGVKFPV